MKYKEKAVVFGLGRDFREKKERILAKYEIIAYTDNYLTPDDKEGKELFVPPDKIKELDFDKVLVATRKYKDAVKCRLVECGIDVKKIADLSVLEEPEGDFAGVLKDLSLYKEKNRDGKFAVKEDSLQLITADRSDHAGTVGAHYFAQDIWAARKILAASPKEHYDIGSRLDGFLSHLLVFRNVNYINIRPLPCRIPGLNFVQADATNLEGIADASIESLSSLHAIEHFGLGRYGDAIDPDAYRKVIKSIQRVMVPKGHVYIGVPVGPEDRLVFNAHRIFSIHTILDLFDAMTLADLKIVKGNNAYAEAILPEDYGKIPDYSCGLFEFEKNEG